MNRAHKIKNHFAVKIGTSVLLGIVAIANGTNLYAQNVTDAAAKASALVKRPVAASPHTLEEFPWALRGVPPPERSPALQTYPTNLFAAAARASAWAKRSIAASPHALEEFPWAVSGQDPPRRLQMAQIYPGNFFEMAAKASAWANRPIAASPHALEEFPWVLRGFPPPQPHALPTGGKTEKQRHTMISYRTLRCLTFHPRNQNHRKERIK